MTDNIKILGDILRVLNLSKKDYSKTIYIITKQKSIFMKLFIDNPNLHFTDFKVQTQLNEIDIERIKNSDKKIIIITDHTNIRISQELSRCIHVIKTTTEYDFEKYKELGDSSILIHRINNIGKQFFENIVKKIKMWSNVRFDKYNKITNSILGSRYIIIRNERVFYN